MATTATMSGLQFDALPYEEGRRRELLEGDCIKVSSPTPRHQEIVFRVLLSLRQYLAGNGTALAAVEFALSELIRLRPDVCVLLADSADLLDLDRVPIPAAPYLAVEVISPTERASESQDKVRAYLRNGTREVWQILPRPRTGSVHTPTGSIVLEQGSAMTSALLPGCIESIDQLFAEL